MEEITQVIEVLIYDSDMSKDELRSLQHDVLGFMMERQKVRGASVSAYVGDCSISRVSDNHFPRDVDCLEGIFDEKEYIPKVCPKCREGVLSEYSEKYGGIECDCCNYTNRDINLSELENNEERALELYRQDMERFDEERAAKDAQMAIEDEADRREYTGNQPPEDI